MPLNVSKGNMYEFVTHTWNTVKGTCFHDCSYCYMKRWNNLKPVRFDAGELNVDLGYNNFIFVGSSCDMWASNIPSQWIEKTLKKCFEHKDNEYLFQTKNPSRFEEFQGILKAMNVIVCTTLETNRWYPDIMRNSPRIGDRVFSMARLPFKKFVTIEPVLDFDLETFTELINIVNPDQVNIGADSGGHGLPEPEYEKIKQLSERVSKFSTIVNKRNLERLKRSAK